MNLKALWNAAVAVIRKLPVAQYIKPVWKGALNQAVQIGGDELQVAVKSEAAKGLTGAIKRINPLIDKAQATIKALVLKAPLPSAFRAKCDKMLTEGIDDLQEQLTDALEAGSAGAVNAAIDAAFDRFQSQLIIRINTL